jgi:hypothetical protein
LAQTHGSIPNPEKLVEALSALGYQADVDLVGSTLLGMTERHGSEQFGRVAPALERAGFKFSLTCGKSVFGTWREPELPERDLTIHANDGSQGSLHISLKQGPANYYVTVTLDRRQSEVAA